MISQEIRKKHEVFRRIDVMSNNGLTKKNERQIFKSNKIKGGLFDTKKIAYLKLTLQWKSKLLIKI